MMEFFDDRYVAHSETAATTANAAIIVAYVCAGKAFQYRDLLLGHVLMSRGLQLLGIREIFYTCYISQVKRESLAHEFLDLRLQGFARGRNVSRGDSGKE